jgi:hypothetical protein
MAKKITLTQEELQAIVSSAVAQALASAPTSAPAKAKGKAKLVEFTKADGTTVQCTEAQAKAWEKWRDGSADRKAQKEANLTKWAEECKAYKPSKALVEAIKKDRASITRKVAKEQYGFKGTKDDLKALKDKICK